jgi:hypothetical protein
MDGFAQIFSDYLILCMRKVPVLFQSCSDGPIGGLEGNGQRVKFRRQWCTLGETKNLDHLEEQTSGKLHALWLEELLANLWSVIKLIIAPTLIGNDISTTSALNHDKKNRRTKKWPILLITFQNQWRIYAAVFLTSFLVL